MIHSHDSFLFPINPSARARRGVVLALSLCLSGATLSGCAVAEAPSLGADTLALETENSLTENSLTENSLTENSLTENSLTESSLVINSQSLDTVVSTESGRLFVRYVIRCALEHGDVVVATVDGVRHEFPGLLGLAPEWKTQALGAGAHQALSACLMVHVNHYGVPVHVSIRGADLAVTADELSRYGRYEGTFYGDLFAATPVMYACSGDAPPDFQVAYPDHDITAGDRLLRRCTDRADATSTTTLCGFTYAGRCSDVCDTSVDGSYQGCFAGPGQTGPRHAQTMSAWLLSHDDADAVWTQHYDALYGP